MRLPISELRVLLRCRFAVLVIAAALVPFVFVSTASAQPIEATSRPGMDATAVDPTNPVEVANAVVAGFQSRDWVMVAMFSSDPEDVLEALQDEPSVFDELIADELEWWFILTATLPITDVRVSGDRVRAYLGDISEGVVAALTLVQQSDGRWVWDDVHSPERESWDQLEPYVSE